MGVSRSASTVIAYIMKEYEQTFKDTLHQTKSKRNCVKPNPGFHKQLEVYDELLQELGHNADLTEALTGAVVNEPWREEVMRVGANRAMQLEGPRYLGNCWWYMG